MSKMNLKIKNELNIITDILSIFLRELFILDKNIKIGTELTNVLVKEIQYYYFNSVTGDLIDESEMQIKSNRTIKLRFKVVTMMTKQ